MSAQIIERRYVVGMTWQQTVQAVNLKRHAPQVARKAKASYFCTVGQTTIGTTSLKVKNRGEKLIALAAGVASLGHGLSFVALRLASGGIWVCGSIRHAPAAGFDQVVADKASAQAIFERFTAQVPSQVDVYCSEADLLTLSQSAEGVSQQQIEGITLAQIVRAAADSEPLTKTGLSIPPPYLYVGGVLLLVLAGSRGWDYWKIEQRRKAAALASANAIDPAKAWADAYAAYGLQTAIYGQKSLRAIREAIESTASSIAGWRLTQIECVPAAQKWACTMDFDRTVNVGLDPTNNDFERLRPRHWYGVHFPGVNLAKAVMDVDTGMGTLEINALPLLAVQQRDGISAVQKTLRAFASHKVGLFTEVQITAPLNKAGEAIPKPAELSLSLYKARLEEITGPLRSVDLFVSEGMPVTWSKVTVTFDRLSPNWLEKGQASLTKSAVTATLSGDIYAKN